MDRPGDPPRAPSCSAGQPPECGGCPLWLWRNCSLATVPSLLLPFPWDPALPFFLQELPRDAGNSLFPPGWLGAPALPTPAPENTATTQGQEKPWGQRSCMEQTHGREAAEWNGIRWRKPRLPCLHWLGTLCCWGSVPLTRRQFELSDALVGVCAGREPRARVPKPNPRAAVAAHSSEIIL